MDVEVIAAPGELVVGDRVLVVGDPPGNGMPPAVAAGVVVAVHRGSDGGDGKPLVDAYAYPRTATLAGELHTSLRQVIPRDLTVLLEPGTCLPAPVDFWAREQFLAPALEGVQMAPLRDQETDGPDQSDRYDQEGADPVPPGEDGDTPLVDEPPADPETP